MKRYLPLFVLLLALLTGSAWADCGPKPSVRVAVTGLEGRECYGTLLSQSSSTGPASAFGLYEEAPNYSQDGLYWYEEEVPPEVAERWQAFQAYRDPDGFHFLQCWWTLTEDSGVSWTYYPPREFKLLLWFPDSGEYRVSGICESYAFDSWYTADLSQPGELELKVSYSWGWELLSLACRVAITLALELALAWVFRYRRRDQLRLIVLVNCVTQLGLNLAVNIIDFYSGPLAYLFWFLVLELAVLAAEALFYCRRLPKNPEGPNHPLAYALCANLLSAAAGLWLSLKLPDIF